MIKETLIKVKVVKDSPNPEISGSATCDEPSFIVALFSLSFKAVSHLRVRACEKKTKSKS